MWYAVNQKNGVSSLGLQKALGLGCYQTVWEWLHKLRWATVRLRPARRGISEAQYPHHRLAGAIEKRLLILPPKNAKSLLTLVTFT
jgi:hypothetical protein